MKFWELTLICQDECGPEDKVEFQQLLDTYMAAFVDCLKDLGEGGLYQQE